MDIVFRHGAAQSNLEKVAQLIHNVLMQYQRLVEGLADGLLGQVVIGGAKAAGGNDNISALSGNFQCVPKTGGIIAHNGVPEYVDAQTGQGFGKFLRIGVDDVAQQQLCTNGNEFSGMCHKNTFPKKKYGGVGCSHPTGSNQQMKIRV